MTLNLRPWQDFLMMAIKEGRTRLWVERDFKANPALAPQWSLLWLCYPRLISFFWPPDNTCVCYTTSIHLILPTKVESQLPHSFWGKGILNKQLSKWLMIPSKHCKLLTFSLSWMEFPKEGKKKNNQEAIYSSDFLYSFYGHNLIFWVRTIVMTISYYML